MTAIFHRKVFWNVINALYVLSFYFATNFLDSLIKIHWSLGVAGIITLGYYFIKSIKYLKNTIASNKFYYILLSFCRLIIVCSVISGGLSYILYSLKIAIYESQNPITINAFTNFYLWKFIDLIPLIKVWETLHIKSPIEAKDTMSGLPILIFQVLIIYFVINEFKDWLKRRKQISANSPKKVEQTGSD